MPAARSPVVAAEEHHARAAAEAAERELLGAADIVRVETATELLAEHHRLFAEAAGRLATVLALAATRTASDAALPWTIGGLAHDPLTASLVERAPAGTHDP